VTGIGELFTADPELGVVRDAAIVIEGGVVSWVRRAGRRLPTPVTTWPVVR